MVGRIAVLGAGAWGTALAHVVARPDRPVTLLCRDPAQAEAIRRTGQNAARLPGVTLGPEVTASCDLAEAADADLVLVAVPAQRVRAALGLLPRLRDGAPIVICAKGIEAATGATMAGVAAECRPSHPTAILSGPSFAADVGRGRPTALCVAASDPDLARNLARELGRTSFRLYFTTDVLGVEIGGASKNVLAIACGVAAGLDLGASAAAALIARGFAEMSRFGERVGAVPETLMGLSGLGDLVLTCSSAQSRNYALGLRLAAGADLAAAAQHGLAEGVATAPVLDALARKLGIDMPIVAAVAAILIGSLTPQAALDGLLARPFGPETPTAAIPTGRSDPWRIGC